MEDNNGEKFTVKKNCNKCEYKENECRLPKSGYYFGDEELKHRLTYVAFSRILEVEQWFLGQVVH